MLPAIFAISSVLNAAPPSSARRLSFADLQKLAQHASAEDSMDAADAFTDRLAKAEPEVFKRCVLMFASGAIHSRRVSPLFPRLVCPFPGADGRTFIIVMTGDRSPGKDPGDIEEAESYADFEIQEYNPKGSPSAPKPIEPEKMDMLTRRITFGPHREVKVNENGFADLYHDSDQRGQCADCHAPREGQYPTPIWLARFFSGSYGQLDDSIPVDSKEYKDWMEFRKRATSNHPDYRRYGYLDLKNNPLYAQKTEQRKTGDKKSPHLVFTGHPNAHFLDLINDITQWRVAKAMRSMPDFARYKYVTAAALMDCPDFESFLPPSLLAMHHSRITQGRSQKFKEAVAKPGADWIKLLEADSRESSESMLLFTVFIEDRFQDFPEFGGKKLAKIDPRARAKILFDTASEHWRFPIIAKLRLIFDGMGVGDRSYVVRQWSALREGAGSAFLFGDGKGGKSIANVLDEIEAEIDPRFPKLRKGPPAATCQWLKEKSLASLGPPAGSKSVPAADH